MVMSKNFIRKGEIGMMGKILKQMTGEELLLMRILNGDDVASSISEELDHRARTSVRAPIIYETIRANIPVSARQAA
jgi:hypothetical protein